MILQLSNPGGVDEVELGFLELSRRFSCCVSPLTLSQTHRTAPALPATRHLVSVACLSFRGSPSSAYGDVSSPRTRVQSTGGYSRRSICKNLERCSKNYSGQMCCFLFLTYLSVFSREQVAFLRLSRGFLSLLRQSGVGRSVLEKSGLLFFCLVIGVFFLVCLYK